MDEHTEKQVENVLKEMPKSYALSASLSATTFYEWVSNEVIVRSQNAEIVMHIKGSLLRRAVILINCIPFQTGGLLFKERICSQQELILSFKSNPLGKD